MQLAETVTNVTFTNPDIVNNTRQLVLQSLRLAKRLLGSTIQERVTIVCMYVRTMLHVIVLIISPIGTT